MKGPALQWLVVNCSSAAASKPVCLDGGTGTSVPRGQIMDKRTTDESMTVGDSDRDDLQGTKKREIVAIVLEKRLQEETTFQTQQR